MSGAPRRLPHAPTTVLFDLDGTLLDSSQPVLSAWTAALSGMGLPPLPAEELHRVIGPPMQLAAPAVLAERGRPGPEAVEEFVTRFREAITELEVEQALAYEGTDAVLRGLDAAGRRLAVVTSKPRQAAERILPALGVADLFVHVEAPDQDRPEPKVATMARAVGALAVDPAATVLVGDRHHDVEAAHAHDVATIGVTWGGFGHRAELEEAGATLVVDSPEELAAALGI